MNIRFISTLTPEDENLMAPVVLKAVAAILERLPISYMLRIDTSDAQVYQHSRSGEQPGMVPNELGSGATPATTLS